MPISVGWSIQLLRIPVLPRASLASGSDDLANNLLDLAENEGWTLSGSATLTTTPFTAIQKLAALGIALSDQQLDFVLQRSDSSTNASAEGQLPTARILTNLDGLGLSQRTPNAAFSYYIDNDLIPMPFLYDPNSNTGARLFNLGSDFPLVVELNYQDGRRGDRNPNPGFIEDPGTVAELNQSHRFLATAQSGVVTVASTNEADKRAAAVFLTTELISSAATSNQFGYVVLQDGETWDLSSITLAQLMERFQVLAGSLENSSRPHLSDAMKFERILQLTTMDRVLFLEVIDGTLEELTMEKQDNASLSNLSTQISVLKLKGNSSENSLLLHSTTSGSQLQLSLQSTEPGLSGFLARQQSQAPVLDFTGLGNMIVEGTVEMAREAVYNNTVGFYRLLDLDGTVSDPLTGQPLRPGDAGYQAAALHKDNLVSELAGLAVDDLGLASRKVSISADSILAPYAIVDSGIERNTYFAFKDANPDAVQHFQILGDNTYGLEDIFGGGDRDFEDLIVTFRPTAIMPT